MVRIKNPENVQSETETRLSVNASESETRLRAFKSGPETKSNLQYSHPVMAVKKKKAHFGGATPRPRRSPG